MFASGFRSPLVRDANPVVSFDTIVFLLLHENKNNSSLNFSTLVSLNGLLRPFASAKKHEKNEVNADTEVGEKLIDQQDHR